MEKIGFGGSCHWCTEAIFQSITGVAKVDQGWIAAEGIEDSFSEGVLVFFEPSKINLFQLVKIHLHTHSCTSIHPMRQKYRSAVYTHSLKQHQEVLEILSQLQQEFDQPIITKALPFASFRMNKETYLDYYRKNPDKPFCQRYIVPKLKLVKEQLSNDERINLQS